jgi:hypothetical protein
MNFKIVDVRSVELISLKTVLIPFNMLQTISILSEEYKKELELLYNVSRPSSYSLRYDLYLLSFLGLQINLLILSNVIYLKRGQDIIQKKSKIPLDS